MNFYFTIFAAFTSVAFRIAPVLGLFDADVVNNVKEYPFIAVLSNPWNQRICGATILNENWLLSSADCSRESGRGLTASFGILKLNEKFNHHTSIKRVVLHPYYNEINFENDLALYYTIKPIPLEKLGLRTVKLSNRTIENEQSLQIVGWGSKTHFTPHSNELRHKDLKAISYNTCKPHFKNTPIDLNYETQFCTYGKKSLDSACDGDIGDPILLPSGEQIGIISYFYGCGEGVAQLVTRLSSHIRWIHSTINENNK